MQMGTKSSGRRLSTRNIVLGVLTATVGIAVLLTGVTIDAIWLGSVGFVVRGAGRYVASKRTTKPPSRCGGGGGSGQQTTETKRGFMEGLESRWDEPRRQ